MNINDFIKDLSIKDKKTLSQKALKLTEEVGELARVILPYDSAHGTNHRFIDKEAILEEIVDVYLTNISIAHSLGITDDEFNEMLVKKSKKWAKLQSNEECAQFPLPYEIHITIDGQKVLEKDTTESDFNINWFKRTCEVIGVKPIILDLEINNGEVIKDVMTSSKFFGDNKGAYNECMRISLLLEEHGYKVLRKKIESVPWHPKAPKELVSDTLDFHTDEVIDNGCYFESHIGVKILPNEKEKLNDLIDDLGCNLQDGKIKLSRNFFKKSKDGEKFINMVTYRSNKVGGDRFQKQVDKIKESLNYDGFEYEKVEVEFAIYDTNVTHDIKWINN